MKTEIRPNFASAIVGIFLFTASVIAADLINQTNHATLSRLEGARHLGQTFKGKDIIGAAIKNAANEKIGTVDNLAVDLENGRVVAVIISSGGLGGIGGNLTAIPPTGLNFDSTDRSIRLATSKEQLRSAPKFETSRWNELWQSNQVAEIYSYYNQPLYLSQPAYPASDKTDLASSRQGRDNFRANAATTNVLPRLGLVQRASKVIGSTVKNLQDENLGDVENLVLDLSSGRVLAVVVSSGGFLGLGEELSAVPPEAFHFSADRDVYLLDISKTAMAAAPHFKSSEWPDFSEPNYSFSIYSAYRTDPYFQSSPFGADNTARNIRDRDGNSLTPFDQSNQTADINLTAQIRKELIGRDDLSIYARNVKIISVNGSVTLRGPVNSDTEKQIINDIARKVAGQGKVNDQLEIKTQ